MQVDAILDCCVLRRCRIHVLLGGPACSFRDISVRVPVPCSRINQIDCQRMRSFAREQYRESNRLPKNAFLCQKRTVSGFLSPLRGHGKGHRGLCSQNVRSKKNNVLSSYRNTLITLKVMILDLVLGPSARSSKHPSRFEMGQDHLTSETAEFSLEIVGRDQVEIGYNNS